MPPEQLIIQRIINRTYMTDDQKVEALKNFAKYQQEAQDGILTIALLVKDDLSASARVAIRLSLNYDWPWNDWHDL